MTFSHTADKSSVVQLTLVAMVTCEQRLCSVYFSQITEKCSAEVLFARGEEQSSFQVQTSCGELIKNNSQYQEEAFYQQYKTNQSLVSAQYLPGMYN